MLNVLKKYGDYLKMYGLNIFHLKSLKMGQIDKIDS